MKISLEAGWKGTDTENGGLELGMDGVIIRGGITFTVFGGDNW